MVMRNRNEGNQAPHWWDDLPPKVRNRFSARPPRDEEPPAAGPPPALSRGELLFDLSRLAAMFFLIAIGNILFLLLALSFLNS